MISIWHYDDQGFKKKIRTRNMFLTTYSKYVGSKAFGQTMGSNQINFSTLISLDFQILESNYIYIYLSMVIQCVPRKGFGSAVCAKNDI